MNGVLNFAVDDRVYALWRGNGCYYNATVIAVNEDQQSCQVEWEDADDSHKIVPFTEITKEEAENAAWSLKRIERSVFVEETENKGRCLFTTEAVDPGQVIFIEAPTLCAIPPLAPDIWKQLQDLHEAQSLSLGTITFYFAAVASMLLLDDEGLQIILDKFIPDPDEPVSDDVHRIIKSLNVKDIKTKKTMDPQLFQRLLSAWRYNSFGHHTEDGLVLYNRISMCAHSCDPSCCWSYGDDDAFVLRARRQLAKGEELTISYLTDDDLLKAIIIRRQKLNNWKFTCCCERCEEPIDYARGFRCVRCRSGVCYYAVSSTTESGDSLTSCKLCNFVFPEQEVKTLIQTETSYANRVESLDKTDIADVELVFNAAIDPFVDHWVLYVMNTILFENCRDKELIEQSSRHQLERIRFHNLVFPRVTFILAWAYEAQADMLQKEPKEVCHRIQLYRQVTAMFSILCGPTHVYTQGPQNKWQSLQSQFNNNYGNN